MVEEMLKLRKFLDEKKIPWEDASEEMSDIVKIDRTHFDYKGYAISVINGFGTYGGYSGANFPADDEKDNLGLLEVMVGGNEPKGWLTAKEAWKFIEENVYE